MQHAYECKQGKPRTVGDFLAAIGLEKYAEMKHEMGYDDAHDFLEMEDEELADMELALKERGMVVVVGHWGRFMRHLKKL